MALSNWRNDENPIHHTDTQLSEKLGSSMNAIFEENEEELRKLKDVKTLIDLYKTTREYKQQVKEEGILSFVTNKMTEELRLNRTLLHEFYYKEHSNSNTI